MLLFNMFCLPISLLLSLSPYLATAQSQPAPPPPPASDKRGLCDIGDREDASVWLSSPGLTWYYNFSPNPTPELSSSDWHFVPMLWGAPRDSDSTEFLDAIKSRKDRGENITHVLGFNEPDMKRDVGGSEMSASLAAEIWKRQLAPLREEGVLVGAPATSGSPIGNDWFNEWLDECDGGCEYDFLPLHWYGPFEGMAGYIGGKSAAEPEMDLWVTEFGIFHQDATTTALFMNQSLSFLEGYQNVTRYSYFGAFRSDESNTGSSSALLTKNGQLTDIGRTYLGPEAQGKQSGAAGLQGNVYFVSLIAGTLVALIMMSS